MMMDAIRGIFDRFLARQAFSLLRPRSSNSLKAAEDYDKVLKKVISLKP